MDYNKNKHDLHFTKFPEKWIDGLFLGNGEIGAMIWGNGNPLKISLDKIDFWENRTNPEGKFGKDHNWIDMQEMVKEGDYKGLKTKYEHYLGSEHNKWPLQPTRLPVPRLEIKLPYSLNSCNLKLELQNAQIQGQISNELTSEKLEIRSFIHANKNMFWLEIKDLSPRNNQIDFKDQINIHLGYEHLDDKARQTLQMWEYPPLDYGVLKSLDELEEYQYAFQEIPEGQGGLMFTWKTWYEASTFRIVLFIWNQNNIIQSRQVTKEDLLQLSRNEWEILEEKSKSEIWQSHQNFWNTFWQKSAISIPDNILENLYYIELYKLACNSRYGKYPCPLQGVWTLDGTMPPWCGDYHIDMNVEETYWPIYSSNHLELGEPLFRVMTDLIPKFEERCKSFYNCEGIHTTCSISMNGEDLHGYYNTEAWPGNGGWLAHMFWLYWKYSQNKCFLKHKAFPFMLKVMQLYEFLLIEDEYGEFNIPLSTSPEFHENQINAWGKNTTCDLTIIKWLLEALLECLEILKYQNQPEFIEKKKKWQHIQENLADFPADYSGFMVFEEQPYNYPHRHMTHLFPIHPFHITNIESEDPDDEFLIRSSLRNLRKNGSWEYTGWTLPWLSIFGSWANNSWLSYRWARDYVAFIKPNSMHINGDWKEQEICTFKYEPMTLEAGFCFIAAINEMLLKSWNGILRICEILPNSWHDVKFMDLRAEQAFLISASIIADKPEWIIIKSEVGNICKFKNRCTNRSYDWKLYDLKTERKITEFSNEESYFEFATETQGEYILIEKNQEIQQKINDYRKNINNTDPVRALFQGEHWFGLQKFPKNPYLP